VKAEISDDLRLAPAHTKDPAKAAYGGVWEGWMCRDKVTDIKLAVDSVTDNGATILYAAGSSSFGTYNETLNGRFSNTAELLEAQFGRGDKLYAGMRPDGNLNIKWALGDRWCTGVLARTKTLPQS
jgi:hypothetical protein